MIRREKNDRGLAATRWSLQINGCIFESTDAKTKPKNISFKFVSYSS